MKKKQLIFILVLLLGLAAIGFAVHAHFSSAPEIEACPLEPNEPTPDC